MINTLPKSLIETADTCLRERNPVEYDIPRGWSIHHEYSPDFIHPLLAALNESSSEFHKWLNVTEETENKLRVKSYLQQGIPSDVAQIKHRGATLPMTHPALYHSPYFNLSLHHRGVVREYSEIGLRCGYSSGSAFINRHLIAADAAKVTPNPHIIHHPYPDTFDLHGMDAAINTSRLPHDMVTYSGVGFDPAKTVNEDGIFKTPAFMSSSTRRFTAAKYAIQHNDKEHNIIQIHHSAGDSGLYVGNRSGLTQFSDDEFIIPRNSSFKVDTTPTTYEDGDHIFHVWNAHRR